MANLLGAVATGVTDAVSDLTASGDLDGRAAVALVALLDFTPAGSVRHLSQVMGLSHAGTVRLVDRLADSGYVERRPGTDSRSITVTLTTAGRRRARRIRKQRHDAVTGALVGLTADQREQLTAACEVLIDTLTRQRLDQRAHGRPPMNGALCRMCDFAACGRPTGLCPAANAAAAAGTSREPAST